MEILVDVGKRDASEILAQQALQVDEVVCDVTPGRGNNRRPALGPVGENLDALELDGAPEVQKRRQFTELVT